MSQVVLTQPTVTQLRHRAFQNAADLLLKEPAAVGKWFQDVCDILDRVLLNKFTRSQDHFHRKTRAYVEVVERIVNDKGNARICKGDRRILSEGLELIVDKANSVIVTEVSEMEIALFCLVAETGCEAFQEEDVSPWLFISEERLKLAQHMRGNFAAYEETLRALKCR